MAIFMPCSVLPSVSCQLLTGEAYLMPKFYRNVGRSFLRYGMFIFFVALQVRLSVA